MKKILLGIVFLLPLVTSAQLHYGNPELMGKGGGGTLMMYDYHVLGVNPANLGYGKNRLFSLGIAEVGAGFQSDVFNNSDALGSFFELNDETRATLKNTFSDKGLDMEIGIGFLATSFKIPIIGGFAFGFRDRITSKFVMNGTGADVLLYGKEAAFFNDTNNLTNVRPSEILDGTDISYLHFRELSSSYGRKLFSISAAIGKINFYTGVGAKLLYGVSYQQLTALNGEFAFRNSFSPGYGLDYQKAGATNLDGDGGFFNAAGKGFAADAGFNVGIGLSGLEDVLNFGFSMTDMGSITWDKNTLFVNNDTISNLDTNAIRQIKSLRIKNVADALLDSSGILQNLQQGSFTTKLPSKLRIGTSVKIGKLAQVGFDMIVPLADAGTSLQNPYYVLAGEVDAKLVKISTGFGGNSYYSYNVPLGIALTIFPMVRLEMATADISAFLGKKTSHMSASAGLRISLL